MQALLDNAFILPLDSDEASIERVGGKGASLAEMARADLPIPPGFHLTIAAYESFIETNQPESTILGLTSVAADAAEDAPALLDRAEAEIWRTPSGPSPSGRGKARVAGGAQAAMPAGRSAAGVPL